MADAREALERLERVCAGIAHPARRQMLLTVHFRGNRVTAGEIASRFSHSWPTTTRHLRTLEEAGLLTSEREGRNVRYSVDMDGLAALQSWLVWFER